MFGKKKALKQAIKSYLDYLPQALSERYGKNTLYTEGQVASMVRDLKLDDRYIRYACLIYCDNINANDIGGFENTKSHDMQKTIEYVAAGGFLGALIGSSFSNNDNVNFGGDDFLNNSFSGNIGGDGGM